MKNRRLATILCASGSLLFVCAAFAGGAFAEDTGKMVKVPAEKARVYVTDSQSWEVSNGAGGTAGGFGAEGSGGARPQTALGASVQEACEAIRADWGKNSDSIRAAEAEEAPSRPRALMPFPMGAAARNAMLGTRIMVASTPDGCDIAVDGSFVGNTPSTINLPEGDHTVTVTRNGYKTWERKIKSMGGNVRLNAELEAQQDAAK